MKTDLVFMYFKVFVKEGFFIFPTDDNFFLYPSSKVKIPLLCHLWSQMLNYVKS